MRKPQSILHPACFLRLFGANMRFPEGCHRNFHSVPNLGGAVYDFGQFLGRLLFRILGERIEIDHFFTLTFPTARRSVSYDSPTASYYYVRSHLGPQGQAAGRLVSGEVEHTIQCWADARRRRWDGWPRAPQGCACNGELDRDRQGSPPTSRPPRGRGATHCGRCAESSEADEVANEVLRCCVPAAPDLRAERFCGPPLASSGYVLCLRRSATFSAAPSTSTVHGCGCPVLVRGDTSVASQHSAPPLAVALVAVVRASHCCTTWPSAPTASRATRTQARSTTFARLANTRAS